MQALFKDIKPFEKLEFAAMLALALAIPFHWFAAQVGEALLLVCAFLKVVFEQKFHWNKAQMKYKWVYIIYASTWLMYLIGMLYTDNHGFGWIQVSKKLGFLIFPAIFLFSDMSYLSKDRIKAIGKVFVAGCLLFFFMNMGYALYDVLFNGATNERFFDQGLMKLYYVQHSYVAMYAGLGMMFCFVEIFENNNRKVKIFNIIAYVLLFVLSILMRSRAGLLCLAILLVLQWIWLFFIMKKKKTGLIIGGLLVAAMAGSIVLFPQSYKRISSTVKEISSEYSSDHRLVQFKGYRQLLKEHWLFGVGTGDRTDMTQQSYYDYKDGIVEIIGEDMAVVIDQVIDNQWYEPSNSMREYIYQEAEYMGKDPEVVTSQLVEYQFIRYAIDREINAHNMFFETIISVGIIGLLLLLAYFVIPLVLWVKTKRFDMLYFSFLIMIAFNMLFESVFEVQMGIIFFCFFNMLFFTKVFVNDNPKITE